MPDYSNADKGKKEDKTNPDNPSKDIQKVVTGDVVVKKKSVGTKFKSIFFGGDFKQTMGYLAGDVLLPALRTLIVETITKGAERAVYGEVLKRPTSMSSYRPTTNYRGITSGIRPDPRANIFMPDQAPRRALSMRREMNEVIVSSKADAESIIERMIDIIDQFTSVSLADLHTMLGLPTSPIDNKWGWTYIKDATVQQVPEGFLIKFPDLEEVQ